MHEYKPYIRGKCFKYGKMEATIIFVKFKNSITASILTQPVLNIQRFILSSNDVKLHHCANIHTLKIDQLALMSSKKNYIISEWYLPLKQFSLILYLYLTSIKPSGLLKVLAIDLRTVSSRRPPLVTGCMCMLALIQRPRESTHVSRPTRHSSSIRVALTTRGMLIDWRNGRLVLLASSFDWQLPKTIDKSRLLRRR